MVRLFVHVGRWGIMLSSVAKGQGSKLVGGVHLVSIWTVITSSLKTLWRKFKDRVALFGFHFFQLVGPLSPFCLCISGSLLCLQLWKTQALNLKYFQIWSIIASQASLLCALCKKHLISLSPIYILDLAILLYWKCCSPFKLCICRENFT